MKKKGWVLGVQRLLGDCFYGHFLALQVTKQPLILHREINVRAKVALVIQHADFRTLDVVELRFALISPSAPAFLFLGCSMLWDPQHVSALFYGLSP